VRGRMARNAFALGSAGLLVLGIAACNQSKPEQEKSQSQLKIVEQVQIDGQGKEVKADQSAAPSDPAGDGKATCPPVSIAMAGALNGPDAALGINIKNGVQLVSEGANMPSTLEATKMFLDAKVLYGPAKAANAGGVATSGLEMSQNSMRLSWTREEVDDRLHKIMISIHKACYETAEKYGTPGNYVNGANIAGFLKVANSMLDQGLV